MKKAAALLFFGALAALAFSVSRPGGGPVSERDAVSAAASVAADPQATAAESGRATVVRAVDGDTFIADIGGKTERVRVIGLDTPETVDPDNPPQCYGAEASAEARRLLDGRIVRIAADGTQDDRDPYGRLLRAVRFEDGTSYAERMIEQGFGFEYTFREPYAGRDEHLREQSEARAAMRGLWGACAVSRVRGHYETNALGR